AAMLSVPITLVPGPPPFARTRTFPALTVSPADRTFFISTVPGPSLVIAALVAVTSLLIVSTPAGGSTWMFVFTLSVIGALIVWLPLTTRIVAGPVDVFSVNR